MNEITDYSIVFWEGKTLIGRYRERTANKVPALAGALELICRAQGGNGRLDVQYFAQPILLLPDIEEVPVPGCARYDVKDFASGIQKQLADAVRMGESMREQMKPQTTGIVRATSLAGLPLPPAGAKS